MTRVLTLNLWGYANPHDYTMRRNTIRGAVPGSPAALRPAPGGQSWPIRRGLILDLLRDERPDVAGLQEVRVNPRVEGGLSAAHQLARPLGWNVLFFEGDGPLEREEGVNGLAILSRHPLRVLARIPLPDGEGQDTYLCLAGEIETADGPLALLTTHFALASATTGDRSHQEESVRRILSFCRTLPSDMPVILTGDLNAPPEERPIRSLLERGDEMQRNRFEDAAMRATGAALATMPSHAPSVQLDYIFVRGCEIQACRRVGTANSDGYFPSDHLGLVADLLFGRHGAGERFARPARRPGRRR